MEQPEFVEELLYSFLNRDLTGYSPDVPPMTRFKQEQIEEKQAAHIQYIRGREWRPSEVKFGVHMNDCLWPELQAFYAENRTPDRYRISKWHFQREIEPYVRVVRPKNGHETTTYFPLEGAKLIGEYGEEFMDPPESAAAE
jgi:hypothetical protein